MSEADDDSQTLELTLVSGQADGSFAAIGRRGADLAIEHVDDAAGLQKLRDFADRLGKTLTGRDVPRIMQTELDAFGVQLHAFVMRGELRRLYDRLPPNALVRICIATDADPLATLPWEFLQPPTGEQNPRWDRSLVRIVRMVGGQPIAPLSRGALRILFVAASPVGEQAVSWQQVQSSIEATYRQSTSCKMAVVPGATWKSLSQAVGDAGAFDVFHFNGHGDVGADGVPYIVLQDPIEGVPVNLPAATLANLLGGRSLRLVVLSACNTSAPARFGSTAEILVRANIPAVVANQFAVADQTTAAFVGGLYSELLQSGDIDRALVRGRIQLKEAPPREGEAVLEWGIPTLHRLSGSSKLYAPPAPSPGARAPFLLAPAAGGGITGAWKALSGKAPALSRSMAALSPALGNSLLSTQVKDQKLRPGAAGNLRRATREMQRQPGVKAVGLWNLGSLIPDLVPLIGQLNEAQPAFTFFIVNAVPPAGLISAPERVRAWARRAGADDFGENVIADDFFLRARKVRRKTGVDILVGLVPAMVAFTGRDGESHWNYFRAEARDAILVSTHSLARYAAAAKRPLEAAAMVLAVSGVLSVTSGIALHEDRGCIFDALEDRAGLVADLENVSIEPDCMKRIRPKDRPSAAALVEALRNYRG